MIKEIILQYIEQLNELESTNFKIVINKDWENIDDDIEIIYCGDNPGKTEKAENRYFVGKAGSELDFFIKVNNRRLNVTKSIFFNKTPCYSIKTKDITKAKDLNQVVHKSIELTIDCLAKIFEYKQIPIFIFGADESSYIVKSFKDIINKSEYSKLKANLMILNHPTYNSLFAAFGKVIISKFEQDQEIHINYNELIEKSKKNW